MKHATQLNEFQPIKTTKSGKQKEKEKDFENSIIDQYPVSPKNWLWIVIYFTLFLAGVLGVVGYRMVLAK